MTKGFRERSLFAVCSVYRLLVDIQSQVYNIAKIVKIFVSKLNLLLAGKIVETVLFRLRFNFAHTT